MIIAGITGFSASFRRSKVTLGGFIDDVLADMGQDAPKNVIKSVCRSSDVNCVEDTLRFIRMTPGNRYLLVGKSMGGIRIWWMLTKYWTHVRNMMRVNVLGRKRAKLSVVLIDPHGWQRCDGKVGSYGVRLRELAYKNGWLRDNVRFHVIYQRNKYPKGARMRHPKNKETNVVNTKLCDDATHWNVTRIGTVSGCQVADAIRDEILWLMENDGASGNDV